MPGPLYEDDWVLCGESEEDLRAMMRRFTEVCRRRGLKVNAGKSKVMVLGGEEWLGCEICVDRICLEHVSKFKYLGYVVDRSGRDEAECTRKVVSGRSVAGGIGSLVNAKSVAGGIGSLVNARSVAGAIGSLVNARSLQLE